MIVILTLTDDLYSNSSTAQFLYMIPTMDLLKAFSLLTLLLPMVTVIRSESVHVV